MKYNAEPYIPHIVNLGIEQQGGLERMLQRFSLDREFVDWVHSKGYKLIYDENLEEGRGYTFFNKQEIRISNKGNLRLINLVKIHELIHIALGWLVTISNPKYMEYEALIDQTAELYADNKELMRYIDGKLSSITTQTQN